VGTSDRQRVDLLSSSPRIVFARKDRGRVGEISPLIIAGTIAFPTAPWTVLAISMVGIIVSSSLIYWFAETLGIAAHFEERKPAAVAKIRSRLENPTGVAFVFLWAFFPLVPTDAVCYVAGSIRMHFGKFIAAITGGELILCSLYVFGGSYLTGYFWR
jgi:uncharacterized membrane protein YdjX (TVP38/TMEM64 family)